MQPAVGAALLKARPTPTTVAPAGMRTADSLRYQTAACGLAPSAAHRASLWHATDGARPARPQISAADAPLRRLATLEPHRSTPEPIWLDRIGRAISARLTGWQRPDRALRRRAEAVQQAVTALSEQRSQQCGDTGALVSLLRERAHHLRQQHNAARRASRDAAHDQALAAVALAVREVHGFLPHTVQLMGALGLLEGHMVEMATGEGKTLTAAMAAVVAGWRGLPCHVVTANDYLARRDAELGQKLFALCGLSVASVHDEVQPDARKAAYSHDIVYTTAKDLLADHLRDQLVLGKTPPRSRFALMQLGVPVSELNQGSASTQREVVMRGLSQVIVDEADSVLIDEAVTPLIISAQQPDDLLDRAALQVVGLIAELRVSEDSQDDSADVLVQRALRHASLTEAGWRKVRAKTAAMEPFWRHPQRARELVDMALYAKHFLIRDLNFIVEDDKVVLIDELTGRLARQRTLSLGMQQILEALEGLPISPPSRVSARMSFQRFFQRFPKLGGMTGTAAEAGNEFGQVYGLATVSVPTHRKLLRQFWPHQVCADEAAKFDAIASSIRTLTAAGRSVLVGMRSVRSSEALAEHLRLRLGDVSVEVLHAVHHEHEAEIVARAGRPGAVTIATNMAGRGTDIALSDEVRAAGGLHVIIGESNDFRRIDRQLAGRCARQGDPGSVQRFVAPDEALIQRFAPPRVRQAWAARLHAQATALSALNQRVTDHASQPHPTSPQDRWIAQALLAWCQRRAERLAFDQRKASLQHDLQLDKTGL